MQQHAILNLESPNGGFNWIFIHHANPNELDALLAEKYNTLPSANELIALGDLSILKPLLYPPQNAPHSSKSPLFNVTLAYHRDFGYPKQSCFHTATEPKRNMDYEIDFKSKTACRDRSIRYFVFKNVWTELTWQHHKWAKNIFP